jgi:hypothetical protein
MNSESLSQVVMSCCAANIKLRTNRGGMLKSVVVLLVAGTCLPAQEAQDLRGGAASGDLRDEISPGYITRSDTTQPLPESSAGEQAFFEEAYREMSSRQRPWSLRYGVEGRWLHDSNVRMATASEGNRSDTAYTFSPYGQFLYGSADSRLQWFVDYRLTAAFFDEFEEENSINQLATTKLEARGAKWTADTEWTFRSVRGGDLDIGGQAQRDQLLASMNLIYQASQRSVFGVTGSTDLSEYENLQGFRRDLVGVFYDYRPTPLLSLGFQFNRLWDELDAGPNQTGSQYLGRVNWIASPKITISGSAGWEQRTAGVFEGGTPVVGLMARYAVSPKVSLSLNGYRNAMMSPAAGDRFFYRTGLTGAMNWQLGERWSLSLAAGMEEATYEASASDTVADREDAIWFFRPNLQYRIGRSLSAECFFQRTVNQSSGADARGFDRDMFGIGLNLSF